MYPTQKTAPSINYIKPHLKDNNAAIDALNSRLLHVKTNKFYSLLNNFSTNNPNEPCNDSYG